MGEGVPSLTIGITKEGKTGMSGGKLAQLFRCNQLDLPQLIYGNPAERGSYKNGTFGTKSRSGRGFTLHTTHRIPLGCRGAGAELHLFPSELIATAAVKRLRHLDRQGVDPQALAPLEAFITHFAAKGLDTVIKKALGWRPTDRFLRGEDEVKPYQPQFSDLQNASLVKWGCPLPPGAWLTIEEIIPGMARAAQTQRDALGIDYNHMAFNDNGRTHLAIDAEKVMMLVNVSCSVKEFLGNLGSWRSGMWQQKLDMEKRPI